MLKDQTFSPLPLIGFGPELFFDPASFSSVNWLFFRQVRNLQAQALPFQLSYVSPLYHPRIRADDMLAELERHGLQVANKLFVDFKSDDLGVYLAAQAYIQTLDVVFSPELFSCWTSLKTAPSLFSAEQKLVSRFRSEFVSKPQFLTALLNLAEDTHPFSLERFHALSRY